MPVLFDRSTLAASAGAIEAAASVRESTDVLAAGGFVGMLVGTLAGAGAGALLGQGLFGNCGDYCGNGALPGALFGAVLGEPLGLALGVHMANDAQGSLWMDSLLSVGVLGLGLAAAAGLPEGTPPPLLLAIPVAQLVLVINAEASATTEDAR